MSGRLLPDTCRLSLSPWRRRPMRWEGVVMEVRNIRWVGVATSNYDAMVEFVRSVMGLPVNFDDKSTVEFRTTEGDAFQVIAPGDPYFDFFSNRARGPVPLFEVSNLDDAYGELVAAGVEVVGPRGRDSQWEWIHFRAPDGNLYELSCRRQTD